MSAPAIAVPPTDALRREVVIANPQGLHLRPATAFAKLAKKFVSTITVIRDDQRANGKSPMELLLLAAEPGATVVVEVAGSDAQDAIDLLAEILAATGNEDQPD